MRNERYSGMPAAQEAEENKTDGPNPVALTRLTRQGSPELQGPGTPPTAEVEAARFRNELGSSTGSMAMEVEGYVPRKSVLGKSESRRDQDDGLPSSIKCKSLTRKSVSWGDEVGKQLEEVRPCVVSGCVARVVMVLAHRAP